MKYKIMALLFLMLSACSSSTPTWVAPEQTWGDFKIHFETRPDVLRLGMNEFLVFVNRQGKKHIPDLLVKIRINNGGIQQAMPDGALGIYRRALYVHDLKHDHLHVLLSFHGQQGELVFPIAADVQTTAADH